MQELAGEVEQDAMTHPSLQEEASMMHHVMSQLRRYQEDRAAAAGQRWKLPPTGQPVAPFSNASNTRGRAVIRPTDDSELVASHSPRKRFIVSTTATTETCYTVRRLPALFFFPSKPVILWPCCRSEAI